MAIPKPTSSIALIRSLNNNPYDPATNPGGLSQGGHRQVFPASLGAGVDVANWTASLATDVETAVSDINADVVTADNSAKAAKISQDAAKASETAAAGSATAAGTARTGSEGARDAAVTARQGAESARDTAQGHRTAAGNSATAAAGSATAAGDAKSAAETARDASVAARTGSEAARDASVAARTGAEAARDAAQTAATQSQEGAARLVGASTTSLTASLGDKTLTTQAGKAFGVGSRVSLTNTAARVMHGTVTAYDGTSLTVAVDRVVGAGTAAEWTIRLAGVPGVKGDTAVAKAPKIEIFDASGTWTKDPDARLILIFTKGGAGGGASGARRPSGSISVGGSGGGGGSLIHSEFLPASLPATIELVVGAKGIGGASVQSDNQPGLAGSAGGDTFLLIDGLPRLLARGGSGAFPTSQGAGGQSRINGLAGRQSDNAGAQQSDITSAGLFAGFGGGSGAGHPSSGSPRSADGTRIYSTLFPSTDDFLGKAGIGSTKTDAVPGTVRSVELFGLLGGVGGPGGWANADGTAGPGATSLEGGGGGGGASRDGNPSGAGGDGAPGRIVIVTLY